MKIVAKHQMPRMLFRTHFALLLLASTLLVSGAALAQPELDSLPPLNGSPASLPADLPTAISPAAGGAPLPQASGDASKQVQDQIKALQAKTTDVSLEDMNRARATLARLELMVEMEQKLADLEDARSKRQKASLGAMGMAIPDTALSPPPRMGMAAEPVEMSQQPVRPKRITYSVSKITGIDGDYVASLKVDDSDRATTVRVGDVLEDDTKVIRISGQGVTLFNPETKTERLLRINMSGGAGGESLAPASASAASGVPSFSPLSPPSMAGIGGGGTRR